MQTSRVWLSNILQRASSSLDWRKQISCSVARALRSFHYLRGCLNGEIRTILVMSLCATHLDYCAAVYSSLDSRASAMFRVALNACIRFIDNIPRFSSVSTYRARLGFLTTDNRRLYIALVLFFKIALNNFPPLLARTIKLVPQNALIRDRSSKSYRFQILLLRHKAFEFILFSIPLSPLRTLYLSILRRSLLSFHSKKVFYLTYLRFNFLYLFFPFFNIIHFFP